ncbi:M20/M25/M40 family metallo-hydrolase [Pectobacteriaceae bacterium CE90]|nr:peptidase dimerization domain-containing protein [Prodigiosinella sp. LS101]WJV52003.1 M20/M25/M40 family metallo-hydrolase [Prodigiosinella sp. LS101]WJV56360.1 M20/M25/M40 family metallo-hydrolase [Pectobacteriaceae bacterium C111]WJY16842.1 M20/M25/M40 family metallo-hydrolase [Pectobacteriaceae bacterium CE90]
MHHCKKIIITGLLCSVLLSLSAQAQLVLAPADAQRYAQGSFPEYLDWLTLPDSTASSSDIQHNATWLINALKKRGFITQQLKNDLRPMVYAEWGKPQPNRKTILFYMHFDGRPITATEWKTDPWKPILKVNDGKGGWQVQPDNHLLTTSALDPEWRIFAHSAADGKGTIGIFLAAIDALKGSNTPTTVNIKVLLDSEERRGSPHLIRVVAQNAAQLKNDGIVIFNGAMSDNDKPMITFGYRGSIQVDMTVFGPIVGAHSGAYGNIIANPAMQLAALLGSMKDANGRVTIPGFYDRVKISDSDRKQMAESAPSPGTIENRYGVNQLDKIADNPIEALQYPSLDIIGLNAGDTGRRAMTVIPATATASINLRTVPEAPPEYLYDLLKTYVVSKGFHIIRADSPSLQERNHYPRLISMTMLASPGSAVAVRTPMDSPFAIWAVKGITAPRGIAAEKNRMVGISPPINGPVRLLKSSYVFVPLLNADDNQNNQDENLRVGNYIEGVRTIVSMVTTPFP